MYRYIAFLKIAEVGSFTKAANLLGYTQPALSQMIASLEKELSMKLLCRSRRGVRLTPEGEKMFVPIREAVTQFELMKQTADELCGLDTGTVRIGTVSSISCHLLPAVIKEFWKAHPNIELILHQGDYSSIQELVQTGVVDFGFVNPNAVADLETVAVIRADEFRAVLPRGHALAQRRSVTLEELSKEPLILLEEGSYSEPLEAFGAAGITPNIRLRAHDDYSIMSMVEQGLGFSILTELVLKKTGYDIVAVPIHPPIIRTMSIVVKDKRALALASRKFIACITENIGHMP